MIVQRIIQLVILSAFAVTLLQTARSYVSIQLRDHAQEVMRVGLEDVAHRLRTTSEDRRTVRELSRSAALAKARAFARIVERDPDALGKPGEMERIAADLDVNELHVSDERGVLVHSLPASYRGYDMHASAQSAAFVPALTNAAFALVQEPMPKGIATNTFFQYAGVARRDKPGIVEVGFEFERSQLENGIADIADIEKSSRLGLDCVVRILPRAGLPPPAVGVVHRRRADGEREAVVETDCGDWRVRVSRSVETERLAKGDVFRTLIMWDVIFLVLFALSYFSFFGEFRRDIGSLRMMFGGRFAMPGAFRRAARNPVTITCAIAFLLAIGVMWLMTASASRREALLRLKSAAADMHKTVNECADNLMFYQGQAIVNHFRNPQAMTLDTVQNLMARYGLDELNVVDKNGIVLSGALADVGYDMGSKPKTAEFNCLLMGSRTYSQDFRAPVEDPNGEKRKYAGIAFPWPTKGYIQIGFSEHRLRNGIDFWFEEAALKSHIGKQGYFIIADSETGQIKSCGRRDPATGAMTLRKGRTLAAVGYDVSAEPGDASKFFEANIFGEDCLCLSEVLCYHRIISAIPLSEVSGGGRRTMFVSIAVLFGVFVIVVFFMTKLANLVTTLQEKERIEHERQLKDLTLAKTIQTSSLPLSFPDESDYKIFARMDTAREVGGDFYDFYPIGTDRVIFLVADVSGKGVPASLFMMRAKAQLRAAFSAYPQDLAAAVAEANDELADANEAEMFVTAWIGSYDRQTGVVEYVNAGHNPPLVRRATGSVEWVRERSGLVLAAMGGSSYRVRRFTLAPGDSMLLYTDGVTEAMNGAGELYGEDRLERTLGKAGDLFVTEIMSDLRAFVAGAEQSDDITMLAFDVKPKHSHSKEKQ